MLMLKKNWKKIKYTSAHKIAFLQVEKQLTGKVSLSGILHDIDKVFLYCFLPVSKAHSIHRKFSRHHLRAKTKKDYIQKVIDWECARITKPDKPLNAVDTLYSFYPDLADTILPIIKELGLTTIKSV